MYKIKDDIWISFCVMISLEHSRVDVYTRSCKNGQVTSELVRREETFWVIIVCGESETQSNVIGWCEDVRFHIHWREEWVTARTLGPEKSRL